MKKIFLSTSKKFSCQNINYSELKLINEENYRAATFQVMRFNPKIPIEEAITPPSSWYLDKEFFYLENEKVFKNNWIGIGSDHHLRNNENFVSGEFINQPYVILNNNNVKKAFYNVCSHHAAQIMRGNGSCSEMVCPYHGWTYNLDGSLVKSTSMKGIKNFKLKENNLKPINLNQFNNSLFLNFNKIEEKKVQDQNFIKITKPLKDSLENFGFDSSFNDLAYLNSRKYHIKSNWKVFIDNYCDGGYHVPYAHKKLNLKLDLSTYKLEFYNKLSIQTTKSNKTNSDRRIGNNAVYGFIYPNILINRYGPWLDIDTVIPINESECIILMEWYLEKSLLEDKEFIENSLKDSELVQDEDVDLCERVMKGLRSDGYDVGRYVPGKELLMYQFHQELYNDLIK